MKDLQLSLDVVGASFSLGLHARRWSRSNVAPLRRPSAGSAPAWQEEPHDSQDWGDMSQKRVPLTTWLQEMGVDVDMSDLLVQGRSAMNHQKRQPMSHAQRARLDRAFVEQLDRIAWERGLPLEDLTQDLQIFRLKLHDRQARRRLHDIFGAKRRKAPPPPEFAKVVPVQTADVPKVKEQQQPSSFPDDYIPRTPKAVVSTEVPQVKEDPSVVPTTPGTPISRIRTPQKPTPQEVDEPVVPVEPTPVHSEEEEQVEEYIRPQPKAPTLPSTPTVQPKVKPRQELPDVKPPTPEVREEVVVEPRGLFRIKDNILDPNAALLFPQRRATKEKMKSKDVVLREDEWIFQEESEKPQSSQGQSRPTSRRRFNLAEQFREALALAWQRALQALEDHQSFPERLKEREEKDEEDEQSSDKEFMDTWTSLFSDAESTENLSLSESAKRLQRRRYRKALLRRTRGNQAAERTRRCWTNRMEVCRLLLQNVDVLAAKGTMSPC